MAIMTLQQNVDIEQRMARQGGVTWVKPEIRAAIQAIEDQFETGCRPSLEAAINTATAPLILTAAKKKLLIAFFIQQKAGRDGA